MSVHIWRSFQKSKKFQNKVSVNVTCETGQATTQNIHTLNLERKNDEIV